MSDIHSSVQRYLDEGLRPIRVQAFGKLPISKAWQNSVPALNEFQLGDNVGIDLGRSGDLLDIDLDTHHARVLACSPHLFGDLPAFGRSGQVPGHRLLRCNGKPTTSVTFHFSRKAEVEAARPILEDGASPKAKLMVLELRAGGGQTVFPPSRYHTADGGVQPLEWSCGSDLAQLPTLEWSDVRRKAGLLAFLAVIAAAYPAQGTRDLTCLHLAGALIHAGVDAETADALVVEVARAAGDEEADQRSGKARASADKAAAGEVVTGLPTLLSHLGLEACEKRLREWLGLAANTSTRAAAQPSGTIAADRPDIHVLVSDIAKLLHEKSGRVYRREAELVRLTWLKRDEKFPDGTVKRSAGLAELRNADTNWLVHEASRCGGAFVRNSHEGYVSTLPPKHAISVLHSIVDELPFDVVRGVSMTPTLSRDRPGYDPETQLLLAFSEEQFPVGPSKPTKEDAEAALKRLEAPIENFPFVDDASKSVALSAMLSAVVRGELETCPMHLFDAPSAGTGKTKLAEIAGILATGTAPSGVSFGWNGEENEKRLVASLRTGDPVTLLDNITSDLEGDFLCQMLTQDTVGARILGASERVRLSTRTLILATGNNLRCKGDMARRVVVCRIDAGVSNPEEREFAFDPVEMVKGSRASLVVDALTVLRAYRAAGLPSRLRAFGNFEAWSLVRGALVWLGRADPLDTKQRASAENPELAEREEMIAALYRAYGCDRTFTLAEVEDEEGATALRGALKRITGLPHFNARSVGRHLQRHRDVPCMGLILRAKKNGRGSQSYWLIGEPSQELVGPEPEVAIPF